MSHFRKEWDSLGICLEIRYFDMQNCCTTPKPFELLEEEKKISCPRQLFSVITLPTPAYVARNIYTLHGWLASITMFEFDENLRFTAGCFLTNRVKVKKRADKTIERITNTSVNK